MSNTLSVEPYDPTRSGIPLDTLPRVQEEALKFGVVSFVYLLHFHERYPGGRRPQHYVGVTRDLPTRMREHQTGNNGKKGSLMRALAAKGIGFSVVWVVGYPTPREAFDRERHVKKVRKHHRLCPVCKAARKAA